MSKCYCMAVVSVCLWRVQQTQNYRRNLIKLFCFFLWVFFKYIYMYYSLAYVHTNKTSQLTNKPKGATVNLQEWLVTGWEEAKMVDCLTKIYVRINSCCYFSQLICLILCFYFVNNICTGHVSTFLSQDFIIYWLYSFSLDSWCDNDSATLVHHSDSFVLVTFDKCHLWFD